MCTADQFIGVEWCEVCLL